MRHRQVKSRSSVIVATIAAASTARLGIALLALVLGGCGLSDVGPEAEKLAMWRASQDAANADIVSGDVAEDTAGSADAASGDGSVDDVAPIDSDGTPCGEAGCDDDNVCTQDSCVASACVHTPVAGPCQDGSACTSADTCVGGVCTAGAAKSCDDSNVCTTDTCDAASGSCGFTVKVGGDCDDDDACTTATCTLLNGGPDVACTANGATNCDDGNSCSTDGCDASKGCVYVSATATCEDGDVCTKAACAESVCAATGPVDCDDQDVCTDDSCAAKVGCAHSNNQAPCDDGKACTVVDTCTSGACAGKPALYAGSWQGPKYTNVTAVLPTSNSGFVGVGADGSVNGKPAGKVWSFGAGDPVPLTWQVTPTGVGMLDVVQLPDGATLAVGVHIGVNGPSGWIGRLDPATKAISASALDTVTSEARLWTDVAAVQNSVAAVVGVRATSAGATFGRVAFVDSALKVGKVVEFSAVELKGVAAAAPPGSNTDAVACGAQAQGQGQAWFARVRADGTLVQSRPFGGLGADCQALVRVNGGGFLAAGGQERAGQSGPRARWWRLNQAGAALAAWDHVWDKPSTFVDAARSPDGTVFLIGNAGVPAVGQGALLARVEPSLAQTWPKILAGATGRNLQGIAWHPAGYVVAVGGQLQASAGGEAPLVLALDPWGHKSCVEAGACATVALASCQPTGPCSVASCDASQGCVVQPRSGPCDDGMPCTAGARCVGGACQAGQTRFGSQKLGLKAGAAPPGVFAAAATDGDVIVAFSEGAAVAKSAVLQVQRRRPAGGSVWTASVPLTGDLSGAVPHFLVHNAGQTWVGGGDTTDTLRWWARLDNTGVVVATKIEAATGTGTGTGKGVERWRDAAPAQGGGILTLGSVGGQATARLWSASGATVWSTALSASGQVVRAVPTGWWIGAVAADTYTPVVIELSASGQANQLSPLAAGAGSMYLGNWRFASIEATTTGRVLVGAWPDAPSTKLPLAAAPRLALLSAGGFRRHVASPFSTPPDQLLGAVSLTEGGLLLVGADDGAKATQLAFVRTNSVGEAVHTWTLPLADTVQLSGALTVTQDGAVAVVTRATDAVTGFPKLSVLRMSPWGHTTCAEAGKCGAESVLSCATGADCRVASCNAALGCVTAQAKTCLPGDPCQGAATCTGGDCGKSAAETDCDDQQACTAESCDPTSGCNSKAISGGTCDDGDSCSLSDTCVQGQCQGEANACSDGVACTLDTCTYPDGTCKHVATDKLCDDANSCTSDTCDATKNCAHAAVALGSACGVELACTGTVCHPRFAISLAVGDHFGCAVGHHHATRCWGHGAKGELGMGKQDDTSEPVSVVPGTMAAVQVVAGDHHVCTIDKTGGVWCWGDNSGGQCGSAAPKLVLVPTKVANVSGATHISAGKEHTCVIAGAKKTLWCWGQSQHGETGTVQAAGNDLLPHAINASPAGLQGVAVGTDHTCVITATGGVACMGWNEHATLGPLAGSGDQPTLTAVGFTQSNLLTGITRLRAGPAATWAIQGATGATFGWGTGLYGHAADVAPFQAKASPLFELPKIKLSTVALTTDHMCRLATPSGKVACSGSSKTVALGVDDAQSVEDPVEISGLTAVIDIATGPQMTCSLRADGAVFCWGPQQGGNLGSGVQESAESPSKPVLVKGSAAN